MPKNVRISTRLVKLRLTACVAHQLNWYRFIGRVLGKALYEGILVDVAFAGFFLAKVSLVNLAHMATYMFAVAWKAKFSGRSGISRP